MIKLGWSMTSFGNYNMYSLHIILLCTHILQYIYDTKSKKEKPGTLPLSICWHKNTEVIYKVLNIMANSIGVRLSSQKQNYRHNRIWIYDVCCIDGNKIYVGKIQSQISYSMSKKL